MLASNVYNLIRPKTFEEFFPTNPRLAEVKDKLRKGMLEHSILLTGERGAGKTTLAEIIAKGLNCSAELQPCNNCVNCKSTDDYVTMLNAGDDRGIDAIRSVVKEAYYSPTMHKYGTLIIDEAGGLTKDAQRALREILEKPPVFRYIILCTSEPGKIEPDIADRCTQLELGNMTFETAMGFAKHAVKRLNEETDASGDIPEDALREIVDISERKARQIINQCYNYLCTGKLLESASETPTDVLALYSALLDNKQWIDIRTKVKAIKTQFGSAKTYLANLAQRTMLTSRDKTVITRASKILDHMVPGLQPENQKADFILRLFKARVANGV